MAKRFKGNDRFIMMLCRDVRRRWFQYGENRPYDLKSIKGYTKCNLCTKKAVEWDHIEPVGTRAYSIDEIVPYIKRMLFNKCRPLCEKCNRSKGVKNAA